MQIRIHAFGRTIRLLSSFDFGRAVASGEVEPAEPGSASDFIRQYFFGAYETGLLRQALQESVYDVTRMSDDDVRAAAAQRLHEGSWRVGYEPVRRTGKGGGGAAGSSASSSAPVRSGGGASSVRRQSAPTRAAPARPAGGSSAPAAAPAAAEWTEAVDQAAFAEVLERAAEQGAPFCEICARLAAQEEAAAA
jgi:hypothetical protein